MKKRILRQKHRRATSALLAWSRMALVLLCGWLSSAAMAAPCAHDDDRSVTGVNECLQVRAYGDTTAPGTLLVWLHGDVSAGGPATYHFPLAEQAARTFASSKVLSVALVRPGYPADGETASTGDAHGRADSYTMENMREVGGVIAHLQQRYHPARTILIGHSGGAATSANLLGIMPDLAQGAVLVGCPCDIVYWRQMRNARRWTRSEDPSKWLDKVASTEHIIALTGSNDENTMPAVAKRYVEKLRARGVDIQFESIDGADHGGSFRSPKVFDAVGEVLKKTGG